MIRREIKKVAQSAAIDLELPKSAIGAKTKVKVHTNTKSDTPVESLAPTPAAYDERFPFFCFCFCFC